MKLLILLSVAAPLVLHAQSGKPIAGDAGGREQAKAPEQAIPNGAQAKPGPGEASGPAEAASAPSLLGRSDILCFNGNATLVPKRAIIYTPKDVAARVNQFKAGSKIISWLDFLEKNRGWITTVEVTLPQARGKEPMDPKRVESYQKSSNLVIGTYKGNPVTVLPPKVPEAPTEGKPDPKNQPIQAIKP